MNQLPAHSPLGASSAYRWLMCPGSVALCEGIPSKSSVYAIEGTAAHALGEECIRIQRSPYEYINGGSVTIEDDDGNQVEYEVTADMAAAVFIYVDKVNSLCKALDAEPELEVRFHLSWIDDSLYGTNDVNIAIMFDVLHVWDYKHGKGVPVDVSYDTPMMYYTGGRSKRNPQLMYYALGALGPDNDQYVQEVEIGIIQPRAAHQDGPIRLARVSVEELYHWRDTVLIPGVAATREENAPLCAGEHCRFCDALAICPEVGKVAATTSGLTAKQVFSPTPVVLPDPAGLTAEQRVRLYEFTGLLESWIKAVRSDTEEKVLAGHDIPGLKVVSGRSTRSWSDEKTAAEEVVHTLGCEAFNSKLKSPAQMEAALKGRGYPKDKFDHLITTTRGRTVAHESDKRPAINIKNAAEVFGGDQ